MNIKLGDFEWTKEASIIEQMAYEDTWGKGLSSYLQMMYDRLVLMQELLSENGSIFVHMDWHAGHYIKIILDEIFEPNNFRNEILVRRTAKHTVHQFDMLSSLQVANDVILVYSKNLNKKFKPPLREASEKQKMGSWHMLFNRANRPTMRYSLLGKVINHGQWMWEKERAYNAVKNYKEYVKNYASKMTLKEFWESRGRVLEFVRANPNTKEPEYWVAPKEEVPSDTNWFDIQAYSFGYGFKTEKSEQLLKRIIEMASNPGDLVADFFCGSGTTLAVAEKLGRRWIGCDLSKFAIHTTRKRLLEIPFCKPFKILNLGQYQKFKLIENGNIKSYIKFILSLYRAEPLSGFDFIHGKKVGSLIHIGSVDSMVTEREIVESVKECVSIGGLSLDILGWDFEMGLHDVVDEIGKQYGVKIKLVQIPKETLEITEPTKEVKFFDLNYLELRYKVEDRKLTIELKDFVIANPEYIPDEIRSKIKKFTDYIDYWSVDFNFKDVFHNQWQSFRTREHPKLEVKCSHTYKQSGKYRVLVKVIDIFGNDTNKLLEVKVD
jgi:adenine-specific DNA-methyltransferase